MLCEVKSPGVSVCVLQILLAHEFKHTYEHTPDSNLKTALLVAAENYI